MDREQFDTLARLVWSKQTRRGVLGAALGAALLRYAPVANAAKRKNKRKNKRQQKNRPCYSGTNCYTGPGRDNAGCDFAGSVAFFEGNFSGSSFHGANLTGTQLAKADLRGVDLGDACLVGANLLNAKLDGADLDGAIFCRTLMPDGTTNDSGCGHGTRCCPTPDTLSICAPEECEGAECIRNVDDICTVIFSPCCPAMSCVPALVPSPLLTTCQTHCDDDERCHRLFGPRSFCRADPIFCPYIGACCSRPAPE